MDSYVSAEPIHSFINAQSAPERNKWGPQTKLHIKCKYNFDMKCQNFYNYLLKCNSEVLYDIGSADKYHLKIDWYVEYFFQ